MARGRAVVTITSTGGTRTYTLQERGDTSLERVPGEQVIYDVTTTTTGLTPPGAGDVEVTIKDASGATIRSATGQVTPPLSGLSYRFVANGATAGSGDMAGTVELDLRAMLAGATGYNVSSDGRGTQTTTTGLTATRERHWQRANTGITLTSGRGFNADNTPVLSFGDEWRIYGAWDVPVFGTLPISLAAHNAADGAHLRSGTANYGSGGTTSSVTLMSSIGSPMPAARVAVELRATPQNHPVSGVPHIVPTVVRASQNPDLDARVTVTRHMQHDDNAFGTPPGSKNAGRQRLTGNLSFLSARLTNARAEGLNDVIASRSLRDALALRPAKEQAAEATTTVGGEAGWFPTLQVWDEGLPTGTWQVTISPTGSASGLLVPSVLDYSLTAADPNLLCLASGGPGEAATDTRHFVPGETFVSGLAVFHTRKALLMAVDPLLDAAGNTIPGPNGTVLPNAGVALGRFNLSNGQAEVLAADFATWVPAQVDGNVIYHQIYETFPGSRAYVVKIPGTATANWTTSDVFTLGKAMVGGVPVSSQQKEITVTGVNNHTEYTFDALAFLGLGGER